MVGPPSLEERAFAAGHTVAGYRLTRLAGEGARATVWVGCATRPDPESAPDTAVLKLYRPGVGLASIDAEVIALSLAAHPHVVELRDISTTASGQSALVLGRLDGGSLSSLIARRDDLTAGEAVTILAPLAAALDAVHAAGVAHGALRLSNVVFRQSGAPVFVGFGRAVTAERGSLPAGRDRVSFELLARTVLERVDGATARALADALPAFPSPDDRHAEELAECEGFGVQLAERLFDLAPPEPVSFGERRTPTRLPSRALQVGIGADETTDRTAETSAADAERLLAKLREHLRDVRPRFWITAASVAGCLLVGLVVVPQGDDGGATPIPVGSASAAASTENTDSTDAGVDPAITGDDPVAALASLLEVRASCVRDASVGCLDAVDQQGSAALVADTESIRALQAGAERADAAIDAGVITLVQRLGDSALLALGTEGDRGAPGNAEPASALVIRGEAGWRIRDYLP
jgi:hypothetical protein